jgi:iron complex outermembrane receptor protein
MQNLSHHLKLGGSVLAIATALSFLTNAAGAQTAPPSSPAPAENVEQVIVTGTSIHGVAPVGEDLVTLGPAEINETGAQTLAQVLENVPEISGMGSVGQGQTNSSYYAPTIHQLGASASNSTLVLIDGHRVPEGGTNHPTVDPNILPPDMIERVEVLTGGTSATYGSDAVAGVINIITRSSFDGLQITAEDAFLNGASDRNAAVLTGKTWEGGSAMFTYNYSDQGALKDTARAWTNPNQTANAAAAGLSGPGITNFNTFNCDPATLQPGGTGNIFTSATSGQQLANTAANSPCSAWAYGDLVSQEVRNTAMLKFVQTLGPRLTFTADIDYGNRRDTAATSRGTVTATAFETGAQANPFYQTPAGYTGTATKETVRWDADALLGPGALSLSGSDTVYGHANLEYRITDDFTVNFMVLTGRDDSFSQTTGTINASVADLGLNGTTNSGGSTTTPSIPGTSTVVTTLPLTAANAIDVWNPAGSNMTSAAELAALTDSVNFNRQTDGVTQMRLGVDGTLYQLPGGPLKIAIGGEYLAKQVGEMIVQSNSTGPASTASSDKQFNFSRTVKSAYAELNIPVIDADMGVPLVQAFDLDISGRYDDYSDFGITTNPKFAFNWDVIDGIRLRGNMSTSFVAPSLDVVGNQYGVYAQSGFSQTTNSISVPVAFYPLVTQMGIPGCTASSVTCSISSLTGIEVENGNHNMQPQKGRGWELGADINPTFLPGFSLKMTYWSNEFNGGITTPNIGITANSLPLTHLITFFPGGASQAQITAATSALHIPQTGTLPASTQYIFDFFTTNVLNIDAEGIDANVNYTFDTDNWGTFKIGDALTEFTKFDQSWGEPAGAGGVFSVLNTVGANQTFPSVQTQMRINMGWDYEAYELEFFVNYTGGYRNWSGNTLNPIIDNAQGNPISAGDAVHSNTTLDMHASYDFTTKDFGDDEVSLDVRNMFDTRPPFYDSSAGYDTYISNPLGRIVTIGFRSKF